MYIAKDLSHSITRVILTMHSIDGSELNSWLLPDAQYQPYKYFEIEEKILQLAEIINRD